MFLCCSILAPRQGLRQGVYIAGQKLSTHSVMELLRGSCPPGEEPPTDAELAVFANTIVGRQVTCLPLPECQATQFADLHAPQESAGPLICVPRLCKQPGASADRCPFVLSDHVHEAGAMCMMHCSGLQAGIHFALQ